MGCWHGHWAGHGCGPWAYEAPAWDRPGRNWGPEPWDLDWDEGFERPMRRRRRRLQRRDQEPLEARLAELREEVARLEAELAEVRGATGARQSDI